MALYVLKFGGTSVGSVERIQSVAKRIKRFTDAGHQIAVVVSAMSGETNRLIALAKEINEQPVARELDVLVSTGEQVTIALLSMALMQLGIPAESMTGAQIRMTTDSIFSKARITEIDETAVLSVLNSGKVAVIAGFQGRDPKGNITTLGRGGSDTSAVAIAAAVKADECRIYTDVDGVYTTDPRVEPKARKMDTITFEEMLELASLGAKVLQIRSVEFAGKYNVPLRVLSSFEEEEGEGTLITFEEQDMEAPLVSGIAFSRDEARLSILGVPDQPNVAAAVLAPIGRSNIDVDMIIQNSVGDNTADFTFTVNRSDFALAKQTLENVAKELGAREVRGDDGIAKISVVGMGMKSHAGVASTLFESLGNEGINIQLISTSEIKISVVVEEKYLELAVRTLHSAFELEQKS